MCPVTGKQITGKQITGKQITGKQIGQKHSFNIKIYVCHSPTRRSILGKTMPEVLSIA